MIIKIVTIQSLVLIALTFLRMSLPTAVSVIIGLKWQSKVPTCHNVIQSKKVIVDLRSKPRQRRKSQWQSPGRAPSQGWDGRSSTVGMGSATRKPNQQGRPG